MSDDLLEAIETALPGYTAVFESLARHLHAAGRDAELLAEITAALNQQPPPTGGGRPVEVVAALRVAS